MIIGLGIDITNIERITNTKYKKRFIKRLLNTSEELNKENIYKFLSKNFSIKESVVKAIGTGFRNNLSLRKICIRKNFLGKPFIKNKNNNYKFLISLSYENNLIISVVLVFTLSKIN